MMLNALIIILTLLIMEFVAWFVHKYVMHGFLWSWHKSHHKPHNHAEEKSFFERNDLFFLVFAIPSILAFVVSFTFNLDWLFYNALGIAIYGCIYFMVHDVYIHQRFKWFKILNNKYSRAICKAHFAHHKTKGKENAESFGLLIVAAKYFTNNLNKNKEQNRPDLE